MFRLYKFIIILIFSTTTIAYSVEHKHTLHTIKYQLKNYNCIGKLSCEIKNNVIKFYVMRGYRMAWINSNSLNDNGLIVIKILNTAYQYGLNPDKYYIKQINSLCNQIKITTHLHQLLEQLDITISMAFALFIHDIYYGTINYKQVYPFWTNIKTPINLVNEMLLAVSNPQVTIINLEPHYSEYTKLKASLIKYQNIANNTTTIANDQIMTIGSAGDNVYQLKQRLFLTGELTTINNDKFDEQLQQAVIQFQENNGLYNDGIVESDTISALNIPIINRIKLIELNLDKMRLLPQNLENNYLLINLPNYSLDVIYNNQKFLNMDVAIGGVEHQSCVLNSQIQYVILNPYWNIPSHIAKDEILVSLKENKNYLKNKHVQVLEKNKHGKYVPINVDNINWNTISIKKFNTYKFRQEPFIDNALGKVKFMFPNQCGMYLHSTNESVLFDVYQRDFSHGCVRVNQPLNLTTLILNSQKQWSSQKIADMYQNDFDKMVHLVKPFKLYLVYLTAFNDDSNWVQFRKDVYGLDKNIINNYTYKIESQNK